MAKAKNEGRGKDEAGRTTDQGESAPPATTPAAASPAAAGHGSGDSLVSECLTAVGIIGCLVGGFMLGRSAGRQAGEDLVRNEAVAAGAGRWYEACGRQWWAWHRPSDLCWIETHVDSWSHHERPVMQPSGEIGWEGRGGPYQPLVGLQADRQEPAIGKDGVVTVNNNWLGMVTHNWDGTWTATTTGCRVAGMPRTAIFSRELDAAWWLARRWDLGWCGDGPPPPAPPPRPRLVPRPAPCALNTQRDA